MKQDVSGSNFDKWVAKAEGIIANSNFSPATAAAAEVSVSVVDNAMEIDGRDGLAVFDSERIEKITANDVLSVYVSRTELREWSKKTCLDVLNSRAIGLIVRLKQGEDYRLKFIKGKKRNMFFLKFCF